MFYMCRKKKSAERGKGTLPSLFIGSNLLRTQRLGGDAAQSDTLSITQAVKAEAADQRREPGFHKIHQTRPFYEFGLVAFMALYIKFTTRLLSVFQPRALISVCLAPYLIRVHRRCLT